MSISTLPKTWSAAEVLTHTDLNGNFTTIRNDLNNASTGAVFKGDNGTVTAVLTFTATQVFTPGSGAAFTVTTGGITVTGNSTITGTLGGLTGLTVDSGGATITAGGLTVTAGGATITDGNFALNSGQANLTRADSGDTGTAKTIDWNDGNIQKVRMTGNCTFTFSNPVTGGSYMLELLQDGTGSRTATWPATVKWEGGSAPTLTTTASRKDVVVFVWNGTNYLGILFGLNFTETT